MQFFCNPQINTHGAVVVIQKQAHDDGQNI